MTAKKSPLLVAAAAVVCGALVGGVAQASWSADDGPLYSTTQDGQTYGQLQDAEGAGPDELPDLLEVVGDSGTPGYAERDELLGAGASTPAEALSQQEGAAPELKIPVYDLDGTMIDTFTVVQGSAGVVEESADGGDTP